MLLWILIVAYLAIGAALGVCVCVKGPVERIKNSGRSFRWQDFLMIAFMIAACAVIAVPVVILGFLGIPLPLVS